MSAPAQTKIRGYEGQVYYTPGGGQETKFANVVEFDLTVKADEVDWTDKSTDGWKDKAAGLKEWSGTVKINFIQSGADVTLFYAALSGGTDMGGSFRPQDVSGGLAYTGTFQIMSWKHAAPMNGSQTVDLDISGRGRLVLGTVVAAGS